MAVHRGFLVVLRLFVRVKPMFNKPISLINVIPRTQWMSLTVLQDTRLNFTAITEVAAPSLDADLHCPLAACAETVEERAMTSGFAYTCRSTPDRNTYSATE